MDSERNRGPSSNGWLSCVHDGQMSGLPERIERSWLVAPSVQRHAGRVCLLGSTALASQELRSHCNTKGSQDSSRAAHHQNVCRQSTPA